MERPAPLGLLVERVGLGKRLGVDHNDCVQPIVELLDLGHRGLGGGAGGAGLGVGNRGYDEEPRQGSACNRPVHCAILSQVGRHACATDFFRPVSG